MLFTATEEVNFGRPSNAESLIDLLNNRLGLMGAAAAVVEVDFTLVAVVKAEEDTGFRRCTRNPFDCVDMFGFSYRTVSNRARKFYIP